MNPCAIQRRGPYGAKQTTISKHNCCTEIYQQQTRQRQHWLPWIHVAVHKRRSKQEVKILGEVWTWEMLICIIIICNHTPQLSLQM